MYSRGWPSGSRKKTAPAGIQAKTSSLGRRLGVGQTKADHVTVERDGPRQVGDSQVHLGPSRLLSNQQKDPSRPSARHEKPVQRSRTLHRCDT